MSDTGSGLKSLDQLKRFLPLIVFVVALSIRLVGIGWGLKNDLHNQSYHPDEEDIFRYAQGVEPAHLKFTPGVYNYGTLYLTTLRVASDMTAAYTGGPDPKNPDSVWSYISRCNQAGRYISALAGSITVLPVFLATRRLFGVMGASFAGAILAFAPAHVVHSRFQTVDVMAVCLLAGSSLFALRLIPVDGEQPASHKDTFKWIVAAGALAGLSAGTKYTGILGVFTLLAVLYLCRRSSFLKDAGLGIGSALTAFVIACPGALLDSEAFMRDFKYEMLHTSTGHGLVFEGTANGFIYHLGNILQGFGTIAMLLGVGALVWCAYRKQAWAIALLAFMLPYYVLIGRAEVKFIRYTFPLYIGLSIGAGAAIAIAQKNQKWGKAVVGAGIIAVGGLDMGGLTGTVRFTGYMTGQDPRDTAAAYLKQQAVGHPDMVVGLPEDPWFWSAPLFKDSTVGRRSMTPKDRVAAMIAASGPKETYVMTEKGTPTQFDKRLITAVRPDFITMTSLEYADAVRLQRRSDVSDTGKALAAEYKEFMDAVNQDYAPDRAFGDDISLVQDMAYVQPHVLVWKRKSTH